MCINSLESQRSMQHIRVLGRPRVGNDYEFSLH